MNRMIPYLIAVLLWPVSLGCQAEKESTPAAREQNANNTTTNNSTTTLGDPAIEAGLQYLLSIQGNDGKWHSATYGNLRDGAGVTALVLFAMASCDDALKIKIRRPAQTAVKSLSSVIDKQHFVSNPEGPDYTNYASAMLLVADDQLQLKLSNEHRDKLVGYLVRAQLDEEQGFDSDNPDYGGWDLTGWMTGRRPTTGTNISVTTCVLEALVPYADDDRVKQVLARARVWIKRCQNREEDGGFFFHPQRDHDGNKAGWHDETRANPRSYGTTTSDGFRCLCYLGYQPDDEPIKQARQWLQDHPTLTRVPGFENDTSDNSWSQGLRFYYYFTLSKALDQMEPATATKVANEITQILTADQRPNGCWQNPSARMREDDPIIATSFAIIALAECKKWLEK